MTGLVSLVLLSLASYLLGAIPFGLVFSRLKGVDPRLSGSKNIGATNVLRTAGVFPAILTLIFDVSKGGVAVLISRASGVEPAWIPGLAAIIGHNFPVYLKFRGGKGVATSIGTMIVLYPPGGLSVTVIWLIVAALTRYSSLAALTSLGLCPLIFTMFKKSDMIGFTIAVAVLAFMRHKDNIKRLLSGTEKKIGERALLFLVSLMIVCSHLLLHAFSTAAENRENPPSSQVEEIKGTETLPLVQKKESFFGEATFSDLKEKSLNKGLRFPEPAILYFLSIDAGNLMLSGVDGESPIIPFKKAEKAFESGIKEALFTGIPYLIETFRTATGDLFWKINLCMLFLLIIIVSILFAFSVASIIRLPLELPLLIHENTEKKITLLYLLLLIAGALGGLPYFAGAVLVLAAIHNPTRSMRTSVILYSVFLLILPSGLRLEQGLLKTLSDPEIRALSEVNESKDNRLILTIKTDDASPQFLFSKALALKREGKIDEAIEIYKGLLNSESSDYRVLNNLANCLFLKGTFSSQEGSPENRKIFWSTVEEYYQKALELKKNPQSLYNLSQLYKERLDFEKGKSYYEEAMKLGSELISSFTKISSKSPNRFLMDITLSNGELFRLSLKKAVKNARALKFHEILLPFIFLGLLFIKPPAVAYRCSRCGRIICNICQRKELWGRMCPDCYEVLITPDKTDSRTRLQRLLFLQKKKSGRRKLFWSLSVLPGLAQIVAGAMFQGLLILTLTGISIMSFVTYQHFFISNLKQFYLFSGGVLSGTFAIMLHLLSLRRLSRIWP